MTRANLLEPVATNCMPVTIAYMNPAHAADKSIAAQFSPSRSCTAAAVAGNK